MLPVPRRPAGQPAPLPGRRRQARASGTRRRPTHAPDWIDALAQRRRRPGRDRVRTSCSTRRPALAWAANYGAIELHPWTSTVDAPAPADVGADRHRPRRRRRTFDDVLVLARLHRTALEHLGVRAVPKVTGKRGIQIWVPVADGYTFDDTRAWVEPLSRTIGDDRARPGQLGVGGRRARRPGPPRLHPERDQQDARRAVQRPARAGRAGVGADHLGRARRPRPAPRPLDDPHRRRAPRQPPATRSRRSSACSNGSPRSEQPVHKSRDERQHV